MAVTAGLGQPSATRLLADRLTAATEEHARARDLEPATTIIELRDHAQDLVNHLLTGFPSATLQGAIDSVISADGLIAVSPIFNASYSGLFKLFLDVLDRDALAGRPVLIAATGGTERHSLALEHAFRPLFAYLGAATVPTAVYAASGDWGATDRPADDALVDRIGRAAAELVTAMAAMPMRAPVDPFADPVPFDQLLPERGPTTRRRP